MKAEKPELGRGDGGGTAREPGSERQTTTACNEYADEQDAMTIEEVLRRENMLRAYQKVKRNKGSAGVDGMTVDELMPYLRTHWARIKDEIRGGRYRPQPVLLVEIAKPGGRGMRRLGIPTVVDRMIQQALLQVLQPRIEGTPQGGPLSPLLSNVLLDEMDRELERRGHRFVRYADDCNIYVRSQRAGERVLTSIERFLAKRLRLKVNRDKSAVDRPWKRKFLGYTMTAHREPKLRIAPESVKRFRAKVREIARRGRGRSLRWTIERLELLIRGWVAYFRKAEVKAAFEQIDQWLRRRLRCILWRQWKRPRTRVGKLMKLGLDRHRASTSAYNGHGPWWNAGASHMNHAVPTRFFRQLGLPSLLEEHRRLQCQLRTAVYGTVRTVV